MFKLGSVIFSNVLKEISSAQEAAFICIEKIQAWFKKGVSKMANKYYFNNLLILS